LVCFVVSIGVRFLVRLRCISSAVCALRTRWPQRALRPLLWDRPRRAARRALRLRELFLLHRAPGQSARRTGSNPNPNPTPLPLLSTEKEREREREREREQRRERWTEKRETRDESESACVCV